MDRNNREDMDTNKRLLKDKARKEAATCTQHSVAL